MFLHPFDLLSLSLSEDGAQQWYLPPCCSIQEELLILTSLCSTGSNLFTPYLAIISFLGFGNTIHALSFSPLWLLQLKFLLWPLLLLSLRYWLFSLPGTALPYNPNPPCTLHLLPEWGLSNLYLEANYSDSAGDHTHISFGQLHKYLNSALPLPDLFLCSFSQQAGGLRCARHHPEGLRVQVRQDKLPANMGLSFREGKTENKQTDSQK